MNDRFERIITQAIEQLASDIHFIVQDECIVYFRQKGILTLHTTIDFADGKKLLNYIRFCSKIDINFTKKPQTGQYHFFYNNKDYYLRVSSLPSYKSDSLVIRILNNHRTMTIDSLFLQEDISNELKHIIKRKSGLFIVSGPTGSGKSTTLYTLLDEINHLYKRNIVTLEDPIEIHKDFCLQIQINEAIGLDYNVALKQILRHDPDVIMIGEIRDSETAKLAITCALTGHFVVATIHSGTCITTLLRLENLGCQNIDIEETLIAILCQKMIYNKLTNKQFVLCEMITRNVINQYFKDGKYVYNDFCYNIGKLAKEHPIDKEVILEQNK